MRTGSIRARDFPAYMGRFDAPNSPCASDQRFPKNSPTSLDVAYAWGDPPEGIFSDPGLNPIVEYQLYFSSIPRISDPDSTAQVAYRMAPRCPGAELRLGRPVFKRRFRIQLRLPEVRLQNLIEGFIWRR